MVTWGVLLSSYQLLRNLLELGHYRWHLLRVEMLLLLHWCRCQALKDRTCSRYHHVLLLLQIGCRSWILASLGFWHLHRCHLVLLRCSCRLIERCGYGFLHPCRCVRHAGIICRQKATTYLICRIQHQALDGILINCSLASVGYKGSDWECLLRLLRSY